MTPAQKMELYLLAVEGRRKICPSSNRLVREGFAVPDPEGGGIIPTRRGIMWLRKTLAKNIAKAKAAHGPVLPEHLAKAYAEKLAVLNRWG